MVHEDAGALPRHRHSPRRLSATQESLACPQAEDELRGWRGMSPIPPTGAWSRATCTGNKVGPAHGDTGSHLSITVSTVRGEWLLIPDPK